MTELSEKFGNLMARMAKTDADLFRTIGDHNKAVTEQVPNLTTEDEPVSSVLVLPPQPLLPLEERNRDALKERFGSCGAVFQWIEEQIGPPPKQRKSWAVAVAAITEGQWASKPVPTRPTTTSNTEVMRSLEQLHQRLDGIESVLSVKVGLMEESHQHRPHV